jgi:ankyrin repeat protein
LLEVDSEDALREDGAFGGSWRCSWRAHECEFASALLQAAGAGDRDAVAEILDAKCDVNEVDAEGWSSLILASKVWHAISLSARNPNRSRSRVKDSGFRVQGSGFRV